VLCGYVNEHDWLGSAFESFLISFVDAIFKGNVKPQYELLHNCQQRHLPLWAGHIHILGHTESFLSHFKLSSSFVSEPEGAYALLRQLPSSLCLEGPIYQLS
jgi:hypothetical protein